MRRISTKALRPGMKTGRPVYNSNGNILINAGVILNERYIKRLNILGIMSLYIDDGFLPDIPVDDVISEQTRLQAVKQVRNLLSVNSSMPISKAIINANSMISTVNDILDDLFNNKSLMVNLVDIRSIDDYVFGHSVNVAVLALMTGISLGYDRAKLFHLGMGALLHDIGKIMVDKQILNKPGTLTVEEMNEIKKHPVYGLEILSKNPQISRLSTQVAYQHHERYNGGGYPQALKEDEIHEFSQITGMVDMYDALTADRVYRRAFPPHEAFEMIAGAGNFLFPFNIIQPFLNNIAAYPAGTVVELSSGEVGVVIETFKGFSLYPKVRILYDEQRKVIKYPYEICLLDHRNRVITKVIDEDDLGLGDFKDRA